MMVVVVLLAAIPILLSKLIPLKVVTLLMVPARLRTNATMVALPLPLRVRRVLLLLLLGGATPTTSSIIVVVVAAAASIAALATAPRRPQEVLVLQVVLVIPII